MIPNGTNGLYQLGKVSAMFRPQRIFDHSPQIFYGSSLVSSLAILGPFFDDLETLS